MILVRKSFDFVGVFIFLGGFLGLKEVRWFGFEDYRNG